MLIGGNPPVPQNECAEMVEENPQTIQANSMSATCLAHLVQQVLAREITSYQMFFDSRAGAIKVTHLTQRSIADSIKSISTARRRLYEFAQGLCLVGKHTSVDEFFPGLVSFEESEST